MIHNYYLLNTSLHKSLKRHVCFNCCQAFNFSDKSLQSNLEKSVISNTNLPSDIATVIALYCIRPSREFNKPYNKCIVSVQPKYKVSGDIDYSSNIKYHKIKCRQNDEFYKIKADNSEPFSMSIHSIKPRWETSYW